jgi:hypothetical protein
LADIEIRTVPPDLLQRMQRYPDKLDAVLLKTGEAALLHVQGSIPDYPPPLPDQRYRRTGTLGRTLGVGMSGGVIGPAQIQQVRRIGAAGFEARLGTNLSYAPDVIGDGTQKAIFAGRWWTMRKVAELARAGVVRLYQAAAERMADWLEGRAI